MKDNIQVGSYGWNEKSDGSIHQGSFATAITKISFYL